MKIQFITRKLAVSALVATALGTSLTATAAVEQGTVGFSTVVDLDIVEQNPVALGQRVLGKAGTSCELEATAFPAGATPVADISAGVTDDLSGDGCVALASGTNGLAGVYSITAAPSQAITVTVSAVASADFSFTPAAQVGNVVDGLGAGTAMLADTPTISGTDANGDAVLVVWGTFAILTDLTPNAPYSEQFDITAVY